MGKRIIIKPGEKFGFLEIIRETSPHINNSSTIRKFLCKCHCGNTTAVTLNQLRNGRTKSCGCYHDEASRQRATIHGDAGIRFYEIWNNMRKRCYNLKQKCYKNYGGRGISTCLDWKNNYIHFKKDMFQDYIEHSNKYGEKDTTIDRINNNGNYCKENCKWSTKSIQGKNKRNNRLLTYKGKTRCLSGWVQELGIKKSTLYNRLSRGWSIEKSFITPIK